MRATTPWLSAAKRSSRLTGHVKHLSALEGRSRRQLNSRGARADHPERALRPRNGHASEPIPFPVLSDAVGCDDSTDTPNQRSHIPVYASLHGRVTKRDWTYDDDKWCSVCNEPIAHWLTHIGRKDHSLLDAHFDQIVDLSYRRWDAKRAILEAVEGRRFGFGSGPPRQPAAADPQMRTTMSRRRRKRSVVPYQEAYDKGQLVRRSELTSMLAHLIDVGVIGTTAEASTGNRSHWFGGYLDAHLVIHEFLLLPLVRLFPATDLPLLCNYEDFVSASYNLETVYDVCGFAQIDPEASGHGASDNAQAQAAQASSPGLTSWGGSMMMGSGVVASPSPSPVTSANDPEDGGTGSACEGDEPALSPSEAVRFHHKTNFVKGALAQLRWCVKDREPPREIVDMLGGMGSPQYAVAETLGKRACRALLNEMIDMRICEYMVRSEQVWHRVGRERRLLTGDADTDDAMAAVSRWDATPPPFTARYCSRGGGADDLYDVPHELLRESLADDPATSASSDAR